MRKARFTEHQIITVIKSVEADALCEACISEATYYNWKSNYGCMEASDIKKIKFLEDENRRLKLMFSDLSLECRALNLSRTVYHYRPDTTRDEPVIFALQAAAERNPRYGFPKLFQVLRRQGYQWSHKRIHRIYCLLKLNFRRKSNVCRCVIHYHWLRQKH